MRVFFSLILVMISGCSMTRALDGQVYSGYLSFGPEVQVFTPCDSNVEYWLSVEEKDFPVILNSYRNSTEKMYDLVYVQFEARMVANDSSAVLLEDFAYILNLSKLLKIKPFNNQCG